MTLCDLENGVMTSKSKSGEESLKMHIVYQYEGPTVLVKMDYIEASRRPRPRRR